MLDWENERGGLCDGSSMSILKFVNIFLGLKTGVVPPFLFQLAHLE